MTATARTPIRTLLAATVWCAAVIVAGTEARAEPGSISGTVVDAETGDALWGATVEAVHGSAATRPGALTDADGHFLIRGVPLGIYAVEASFVGYRVGRIEDVQVGEGKPVQVDLVLTVTPYMADETVVSASRRQESIIDAPASVVKLESAEIQRRTTASSYMEMIRDVKGIDYFQNSVLSKRVNARGYNSAFNYRMLILMDGRVSSAPSIGLNIDASTPIPKDDVQDIEVITGPGSALYGPDATSGVISITTKDPRRFPGTSIAVAGGSRSTCMARLYHAGKRDGWGWKVTGDFHRAQDYEQVNTYFTPDSSLSRTDDPDFDAGSLRGAVGLYYYPDDESRWALLGGVSSTDYINVSSIGRNQLKGMVYHYQQLVYTSPDLYLSAYHTGDDMGDSHSLERKARGQMAGLSEADAKSLGAIGGHSSMLEVEGRYSFQLSALRDTRVSLGANFRQYRPETDGLLLDDAEEQIIVEQAGFYGQSETWVSEQVRLVLASRLDRHDVYEAQLSPKVALIYKPREHMALRASYNRAFQSPSLGNQSVLFRINSSVIVRGNGEGFRFGTMSGDPLPSDYVDGIAKLVPEENSTLELGFKGVLANKVFLDISAYRSRYEDFISPAQPIGDLARGVVTLDEDGNPRAGEVTLTYLNFGRQTVWGMDVGANAYLSNRLEVRGNTSLIDAGTLEAAGGIDHPLNTAGLIYNLGLTASDLLRRGSLVDVSLRHVNEFDFRSGINVGTVPAYTVVDLSLGYPLAPGLDFRVSASNTLNNRHREFVSGPEIGRLVVGELQYAL